MGCRSVGLTQVSSTSGASGRGSSSGSGVSSVSAEASRLFISSHILSKISAIGRLHVLRHLVLMSLFHVNDHLKIPPVRSSEMPPSWCTWLISDPTSRSA